MSVIQRYRSRKIPSSVIAFSMSYQRENLLPRGLGLEHLRELLLRLARPILRQGASLAYGGDWEEREDNFTYDLLRLIRAEQEDNSLGGPDTNLKIGILYNHVAWPFYNKITPRIEAQSVSCCSIVRITQELAGFSGPDLATNQDWTDKTARGRFNAAVTLSTQRRLMMSDLSIQIPDISRTDYSPAVVARIILAGKLTGYSGFIPGLFEEALVTLQANRPLYILGGFGGAAETLAQAMLGQKSDLPDELTVAWSLKHNPQLNELLQLSKAFVLPPPAQSTEALLQALSDRIKIIRGNLSATLSTGLSEDETRELMTTGDVATAVHLVRKGLIKQNKLPILPA